MINAESQVTFTTLQAIMITIFEMTDRRRIQKIVPRAAAWTASGSLKSDYKGWNLIIVVTC